MQAHREETAETKVFGLEGDVYRLARLAGRGVPEVALARFELVRRVDRLRLEGLTVAGAIAAVGLSRASYHRWRAPGTGRGRAPRAALATAPSAAAAGLEDGAGRGHRAVAPERPEVGPGQAGGAAAGRTTIKHVTAYCPVGRWTVAKATTRATSTAAAAFLDQVLADMPFPVSGLQVDGGSEFMAAFARACQAKGLQLFVVPPKSPQLNGAVERANGSWRYDFYAVYDLPDTIAELSPPIESFQHPYDHYRPHGALQGLTPAQYLATHHGLEPPPSQMF